ncbi:MAG: FHA domain-containing protein [Deltaproteobacteria bacterium]|nr:FHA domain-containing protein [Deltaproteobacteria bacterium]
MKFRHTIEKIGKNGARDVLNRDYDKSELVLGRGSASDIIFESNLLSLTHVKLTQTPAGLRVEDLGSLSGTRVNGSIVREATLQAGDEIKIGDISLTVFHEGGLWGVRQRMEESEKVDTETLIGRDLARADVFQRLPRIRLLSLMGFIIVGGWFFVLPLMSQNKDSWNSGPISNNHAMIAHDCHACHADPFVQVQDAQCLACHNMSEHSEVLEKHEGLEGRCASCHMEHNGDHAMVLRDSRMCVTCHADIKQIHPDSGSPNVPSFKSHPEFSVAIQPVIPGGVFTKVRLDDAANLKDNSNVKLNHEIHLKTLRGKDGPVRLDCRDCHNASEDLRTIEKVNFEKHCESCHTLEFDDRLPAKEVPHGDPDVVYKFLYAEYAKLLLSSNDNAQAARTFNRFKPGGSLAESAAPNRQDDFKRSFVERESRNAERQLFTKTACYLCHLVVEKDISLQQATDAAVSRYTVLQPQIPDRWMPGSTFSHKSHEAMRCDDCHKGVRESTKTNQVLLPRVEKCLVCHNDDGSHGMVKSDCVMCHSYHDEQLVPPEAKRLAEEILSKK